MTLDFLVINTYTVNTIGIADTSTYDTDPPVVVSPSMSFIIPGFSSPTVLPFVPLNFNVFNSLILGLSTSGQPLLPLPDGVWTATYSVDPAITNYVTKTFMRIDRIQEKYDSAFMKLDMMECDSAIRTQSKVTLSSIYFMIQGAVAAANNCAIDTANKLYMQADNMLTNFINNNCGCSGNNYTINFY
jgi:hypothetical protein